jgi:TRAP-type C4-dicarboxylate transport system permease small subunit
MAYFNRAITLIAKSLNLLACAGLVAIMVIICGDVIGRYFDHPIDGAYDLVIMIATIVFSFALANTQLMRAHTGVNFLIIKLPWQYRRVIEPIFYLVSMVISLLFTWRSAVLAHSLWIAGLKTMTIDLPYYLFVYGLSFGCLSLTLVFLMNFVESLAKKGEKQ